MQFSAYMLDVISDSIYPARILVEEGIFKEIVPIVIDSDDELDIDGIILPGFIDSHIHIESTMLTPAQFAKLAVRFGTTSVVCDPHEIANVAGVEGIEFMIDNAKSVPFNFYFSAPSCVPATCFETSGAILDSDDIGELLKREEVVALAEMMNFPGVINDDLEVLAKLQKAHEIGKPVDGHAPLLSGEDLDKYIAKEISTDHECSSFAEAIEKKEKGMKIMVRDGSSAKNMEALFDFNERLNYWKNHEKFGKMPNDVLEKRIHLPIFDFIVSDDKHTTDLIKGHLNESIKKAIFLDINPINAVEMVTINPSTHYKLNTGAIVKGMQADYVIVDNLVNFNILKTYIKGQCVFDGENVLFDVKDTEFKNTFDVSKKQSDDFEIFCNKHSVEVNVIKCFNGELITEMENASLTTKNDFIEPDLEEDILKIAIVERYGGNSIVNGFIKGFNLKKGAIASSVAHDSHNIVVVGTNSEDMAKAVNCLIENKGGFVIVDGDFEESLALPIAGLMTNEDSYKVAEKLEKLQKIAIDFGCKLDSPFMTMSFMALLVIPSIKISDKGLFDCTNFEFIEVIKN
ncbi:adenine deaminase [uncultured Methanobrevibacter sp.]|uniref:adenine deaminase n=1 Tax=uncultured Methanobrevibacter sp. TaxID=253161 RepID=UPI00261995D0|nr:adenine deaminase [uncultured Methanobrevibacter sp.]